VQIIVPGVGDYSGSCRQKAVLLMTQKKQYLVVSPDGGSDCKIRSRILFKKSILFMHKHGVFHFADHTQ